jgi:succinate-acetate transporter protein
MNPLLLFMLFIAAWLGLALVIIGGFTDIQVLIDIGSYIAIGVGLTAIIEALVFWLSKHKY